MSEEMKIDKLENGTVNISDDVIGIITSIAVSEVEGVHGFHAGFAKELAGMFGMKNHKKGVGVKVEGNEVTITLHLVVNYGENISEIAMNVQSKVKTAVETMTELTVKVVDVFIDSINIPNKKVKDVEVDIDTDIEQELEDSNEQMTEDVVEVEAVEETVEEVKSGADTDTYKG